MDGSKLFAKMKLKTFYLLFIYFIVSFSFTEEKSISRVNFEVLRHYNQNELNLLQQQHDYPKQCIIKLENRKIILVSDNNYNTIISLYDNYNNLLDSIAVIFMYKSANSCNMYSSEVFCLEGFSTNTPGMIFYLVYCNNDSDSFLLFPINRKDFWGIYANKNSIYYSLEYEKETIKRINISDTSTYSYPYTFSGGVDIFSYEGEPYFIYKEKGISTTYIIKEKMIEKCTDSIKNIPKNEIVFND